MKQDDLLLKEAHRSFEKKLYAESALLLDRLVTSGTRDVYPVFLHAVSCLLAGRFADADASMRRLDHIDPAYPPLLQLRSFLFFKAAPDLKSAIAFCLEILAKNPGDTGIRKAVSRLRRVRDFQRFQMDSRLLDFVSIPSPGRARFASVVSARNPLRAGKRRRPLRGKFRLAALLATGVIAAGLITIMIVRNGLLDPLLPGGGLSGAGRDTVDQVTIDGSGFNLVERIAQSRTMEFYHSGENVLRDFNAAKKMIKDGKYNAAVLLLNKIGNSNAVYSVKERAEFLRKFVINIEDRDWQDVPFREVRDRPQMHIGTAVRWKGKIANLKRKEGKVIFNLMVNSRNAGEFDGIVDVYSEHDYADMKNGGEAVVRAVILHTIGDDKRLYLSAREIEFAR